MSCNLEQTAAPSVKITDEFPWMSQAFVMARPTLKEGKYDWSHYDGSTSPQGREYRPVMLRGVGDSKRVWVLGSAYAYPVEDFEFDGDITIYDPVEKTTTVFVNAGV